MPDRQPDPRSLNFAGDVTDHGQPLPMTVEVLRSRAEKWPQSSHTPSGIAALLARSRQMFIDGYYTYENFMDAATRSLQAVEAALRVRFDVPDSANFYQLIERAKTDQLVDEYTRDILHVGRTLRNTRVHATNSSVVNPAIAARIIGSSHKLVASYLKSNSLHSPARKAIGHPFVTPTHKRLSNQVSNDRYHQQRNPADADRLSYQVEQALNPRLSTRPVMPKTNVVQHTSTATSSAASDFVRPRPVADLP